MASMKSWTAYYKQAATWMIWGLPLALPLYLVRFKIGPLPTTLLEVYLLVLFVTAMLGFGTGSWKKGLKEMGEWKWPVLLWSIATLAAVFWSPSIVTGFGLWRAYVLEPVLVFVLLFGLREIVDRKQIERSMRLVITIVGFWAIYQFISGQGIPSPWNVSIADGRRATGPFPYPNALALFVVPMGAYLFARWIEARREWWLLTSWGMSGFSAFLAKSDGGMLALASATWFVLFARKETRRVAIALAVVGVVLIALVAPLRNAFIEQATFSGWSGRVRTWTWTETWNMLKDRPVLGAGFGGYPIVFKPYHEKTFIEIFQYPHTIVLNVWSEAGLVGLLAYTWIVVTWTRQVFTRHASRDKLHLLAPLIAILIHGLVDVPYFKNDLAIAFWLLAFLATIQLDREAIRR
jgi:O-antigen ligase